jgi:hypothetical protein
MRKGGRSAAMTFHLKNKVFKIRKIFQILILEIEVSGVAAVRPENQDLKGNVYE